MDIVHFSIGRYHIDVYCLRREMITIEIEIKDRNRIKEFIQNFHSKAEDLFFTIISKIPEMLIPSPIMDWLDRYLNKRISELKQESIKMNWRNMYLQSTVDEIHAKQQNAKKAPSDD